MSESPLVGDQPGGPSRSEEEFKSPLDVGGVPPPADAIQSVYVHAPFCPRRCIYCDFDVTVAQGGDPGGWLEALQAELRMVSDEGLFPLASSLKTLYVGGGTPSFLGPGAMDGLAGVLGRDRLTEPSLEWTVEANPESLTAETARAWSMAGVNRISLGAQTFHDPTLRWMGRLHSGEESVCAVVRARAVGIENISLDLVFGLPEEVQRDWNKDLESALALEVPHLSLYGLSVEKGTPLATAVEDGHLSPASEDRYGEEFLFASHRLTELGYRQYELSNFALPGFEARHNLVYWSQTPYLGLGPSAHSYRHPKRRWNLKQWGEYENAVCGGRPATAGGEVLGFEDIRLERIWLGLRSERGVRASTLHSEAQGLVEGWASRGWAVLSGDGVRLTPVGWLMLDSLAVELDSTFSPPG